MLRIKKRLLNDNVNKMKSTIRINNLLMNSNVKENSFSNDIHFSKNVLLTPMFESDLAVNFLKNIISNNNIEEESTLKRIIESVKKNLIKGTER